MSQTVPANRVKAAHDAPRFCDRLKAVTKTLPTRSELEPNRTWDAWSVFDSFDAWQAEMDALEHDIAGLQAY